MPKSRVFHLAALVFIAACEQPGTNEGPATEVDVAEVRAAIAQVDRQWEQAANSGNAAGVAALYADDGRLLAPNSDIVQGRENIQQTLQGLIDIGLKNVRFTTVDVGVSGDLAYEVGRYSLDIQPRDAPQAINDQGKYVIVARKGADGAWKIVADIFNTSQPAPGAQ